MITQNENYKGKETVIVRRSSPHWLGKYEGDETHTERMIKAYGVDKIPIPLNETVSFDEVSKWFQEMFPGIEVKEVRS